MRKRRYNCRADEIGNPYGYQITFRANRKSSALFSSCRGLIRRFSAKKMTMIDIFETVMIPAMEEYCRPFVEEAKKIKVKNSK